MNTNPRNLQRLISPLSMDAFIQDFWPHCPLYIDGHGRDPNELLGFKICMEFDALSKMWPRPALVMPRKAGDEALGEVSSSALALKCYRAGHPVFLSRPEEVFEELGDWIEQLRIDLSVDERIRFVSAFHASPGGTNTALHFDHAVSIVVQIRGERIWRLWPNTSHKNPTNRYSVTMSRWPDELIDYGNDAALPEGSGIKYLLRPGDCLVVPNGWWHTVEAPVESMALMFIAINFPWADVVLGELRRRLLTDSRWREMAIGVRQVMLADRETARQKLGKLLSELPSIVSSISVDDVLLPHYRKSVDASAQLIGNELNLDTSAANAILRLGPEEFGVFNWIELRMGSFTERDLLECGFEAESVTHMLQILHRLRYLTCN